MSNAFDLPQLNTPVRITFEPFLTSTGKTEVSEYLYSLGLYQVPDWFTWETGNHKQKDPRRTKVVGDYTGPITYQGKLATRLIQLYKVMTETKLDNYTKEKIGQIIAQHTLTGDWFFELSQDCDWSPGDFGDRGSCFWGEYEDCRLALHDNPDGMSMRVYSPDKIGCGRAWVWDYRETRGYLLLFNGYLVPPDRAGSVHYSHGTTQALGGLLAQWLGQPYRKVPIDAYAGWYINSSSGVAIGPQSSLDRITAYALLDINLDDYREPEPYTYCEQCDEPLWDYSEVHTIDFTSLCQGCYNVLTFTCEVCGNRGMRQRDETQDVCISCWDRLFITCSECGRGYNGTLAQCPVCGVPNPEPGREICPICNQLAYTDRQFNNRRICGRCLNRYTFRCDRCGNLTETTQRTTYIYDRQMDSEIAIAEGQRRYVRLIICRTCLDLEFHQTEYCNYCDHYIRRGGRCPSSEEIEG